MYIDNISIKNLRIIENIYLEKTNRINFILGENAQGKSSILEGLYILATSKSNRTFKDKEFINVNNEISTISCDVFREKKTNINLSCVINKNHQKAFFIDNTKKSKIIDTIGELNSVIFSINDIEMIKGDPQKRRNFLNLEISQIYPIYTQEYVNYKKTLLQRNNILKDIKNNIRQSYDILEILDIQLSLLGAKLIIKRNDFIKKISESAKNIYNILSNNNSNFSLKYQVSPKIKIENENQIREEFLNLLKEKKDLDIKMGTTTIGPHRDDLDIRINDLSVKNFGSGGEIRSCAFALKMSLIEIIKQVKEEYPIVLLDDLMSELDYTRREKSIEIAGKNSQLFITTTHLDNINLNENTKLYYLKNGNLVKEG